MTIDEAIAHAREAAAIQRNNDKLNKTLGVNSPYYKTDCLKCAEEHEQLAEWLEELKSYRDKNKMVVRIDCINAEDFKNMAIKLAKQQYDKAIDDFLGKIQWEYLNGCRIKQSEIEFLVGVSSQVAEQLKAGRENDKK